MKTDIPVYIGKNAIASLICYCKDNHLGQFMLVADQNTYPALGHALETSLKEQGLDINTVILPGKEVIADEHYLIQVLLQADRVDRTYLAVGSGTITDIVRFASHRTKADFISVPTAPSVDGFTSIGAPLVISGLKQTVIAQPPIAVFADLNTLAAAPCTMIASGFADVLGKYTSLADWQLGQLLWNEPYSAQVAQRTRRAVESCAHWAEEIGQGSSEGILYLMEGLIESGLSMLEFGSSRPASGAEHHMSHYWEMKLLKENRPAILHGAKVGVATIFVAKRYEEIKRLTRSQVIGKLKITSLPNREHEIKSIRTAYESPVADQIVAENRSFLDMTEQEYELLKEKIVDYWPEIQEIAASVPNSQEIVDLLKVVGGPTDPKMLGLTGEEIGLALKYSHYLRNRFTVMKLSRALGIE